MSVCWFELVLNRVLEFQDFAAILWEISGFSYKLRALRNWLFEMLRNFCDFPESRFTSKRIICEVISNGAHLCDIYVNTSQSFYWTPQPIENLVTLRDIPHLEDIVDNSRVKHRINLNLCDAGTNSQASRSSMGDIEDASPITDPDYKSVPGPRSSTPLSYLDDSRSFSHSKKANTICATPASTKMDSATLKRIVSLEEELAALRSQMAAILHAQEKQNYNAVHNLNAESYFKGSQYFTPCQCKRLNSTSVFTSPALKQLQPPPPPPPPPPLPLVTNSLSLKEQIQKNKSSHKVNDKTNKFQHNALPNMADVLKGLGSVKLRPIERSPGGTPLRKSLPPANPNEISAILTLALRKRMANMNPDSTIKEVDTSEDNNSFSSIDKSPFMRRSLVV